MSDMLDAITQVCAKPVPPSDPGYTVAELADHWGCGVGEARKRVKSAFGAGKLVTGKRWRIDAAGRCIPETVYRAA